MYRLSFRSQAGLREDCKLGVREQINKVNFIAIKGDYAQTRA